MRRWSRSAEQFDNTSIMFFDSNAVRRVSHPQIGMCLFDVMYLFCVYLSPSVDQSGGRLADSCAFSFCLFSMFIV